MVPIERYRISKRTLSTQTVWLQTVKDHGTGSIKRSRSRKEEDALGVKLWTWFEERRKQNCWITPTMLQNQAKIFNNGVAPPRYYLCRWRFRHNIVPKSIHRKTMRPAQEIVDKLHKFHNFVQDAHERAKVFVIINTDQIPMSFCGSMNISSTLDVSGSRNVMVASDPAWERRCASFMPCLAVVRNGNEWVCENIKGAILLRRTAKKKWSFPNTHGWLIEENCTGVVNGAFTSQQFIPHITRQIDTMKMQGKIPQEAEVCMMVLDSASGHLTDAVQVACSEAKIVRAVIPGGLTMFEQAIDVVYAALFRNYYFENHFLRWLSAHLEKDEANRHVPSYQAAGCRIQWLVSTHNETVEAIDVPGIFSTLGYVPNPPVISISGVQYTFRREAAPPLPPPTVAAVAQKKPQQKTLVQLFARHRPEIREEDGATQAADCATTQAAARCERCSRNQRMSAEEPLCSQCITELAQAPRRKAPNKRTSEKAITKIRVPAAASVEAATPFKEVVQGKPPQQRSPSSHLLCTPSTETKKRWQHQQRCKQFYLASNSERDKGRADSRLQVHRMVHPWNVVEWL